LTKSINVHKLAKECHIDNVVWELLRRCKFGDKRFAWDGEDFEDDIFYTPLKSLVKENRNCNLTIETSQTHLQVHGYVHSKIIKQLCKFETSPFAESPSHKQSPSKKKWKSIIKIPDRQQVFKRPCLIIIKEGAIDSFPTLQIVTTKTLMPPLLCKL
jgi:hypothetical protein